MKTSVLKALARTTLAAVLVAGGASTLVATTAPQAASAYPVGYGYHHYYRFVHRDGGWFRVGFYDAPAPGYYGSIGYVGWAPPEGYYPSYAYAPAPYYAPAYGPSFSLGFVFGGRGGWGRSGWGHGGWGHGGWHR